jgi:hypothetical protein
VTDQPLTSYTWYARQFHRVCCAPGKRGLQALTVAHSRHHSDHWQAHATCIRRRRNRQQRQAPAPLGNACAHKRHTSCHTLLQPSHLAPAQPNNTADLGTHRLAHTQAHSCRPATTNREPRARACRRHGPARCGRTTTPAASSGSDGAGCAAAAGLRAALAGLDVAHGQGERASSSKFASLRRQLCIPPYALRTRTLRTARRQRTTAGLQVRALPRWGAVL